MKIIINYDFINRMKLLNNPNSKLTLIKCRTNYWVKKYVPILFFVNTIMCSGKFNEIITAFGFQYLITLLFAVLERKSVGFDLATKTVLDKYKKAILKLSCQLQDLNIATNYDLLLQSEEYYKETKIELNDNNLPMLVTRKYINVPSYDYNGDIKEVSVEQEHVIGSKEYVLTFGSPKTVNSFAASNI